MTIEIRPVERDRADDYVRAVTRGFHDPVVDERDLEVRSARFLDGRWWAALDDGAIVSTVRTLPLETTMPGAPPLVSCAVTAVTTASTHRRRGLMAEAMRGALRQGREWGEPLTTLIAAEWPIYGRFGFGPAVDHAAYEIDAARVRFTTEGSGRVELVTADAYEAAAPAVYDRHRLASPGEIERDAWHWRTSVHGMPSEPFKGFHVLCRADDGTPTGCARYTIDKTFDQRRPNARVDVEELFGDDGAEVALWRYVTGIDWITRVTAETRSADERLPFLVADGRHVRLTERADLVWVRLLDVAACLTGRAYAAPVDAVIEVVDPLGLSGGRWRLRADAEGATCVPCTDTADLTLPVATLGSILFGGYSLGLLARAGLADEHRAGAVRAAGAAFHGDVTPWSATWF